MVVWDRQMRGEMAPLTPLAPVNNRHCINQFHQTTNHLIFILLLYIRFEYLHLTRKKGGEKPSKSQAVILIRKKKNEGKISKHLFLPSSPLVDFFRVIV